MKPPGPDVRPGSSAKAEAAVSQRGRRIGGFAAICLFCFVGALALIARHMSEIEPDATATAFVSPATAQSQEFRQRHGQFGVACATCHGTDFSAGVPVATCLACHGSYEVLAERSRHVVPNPHAPHHLGEVRCGQCHREHQASVLFCNRCHIFDGDVP